MEEGKKFERRPGREPAGEGKEKKPEEEDEELPPEDEDIEELYKEKGGESG